MLRRGDQFPGWRSVKILTLLAGVLVGTGVARAQSADPADIAAGMRLFHQQAHCQACHGWAGDGRCRTAPTCAPARSTARP
jgi:mono/diheme cytochrome c family protein